MERLGVRHSTERNERAGDPSAEQESVEDLLVLARDLSQRLLRRQRMDPRGDIRVARALCLSVVDALESVTHG